MDFSVPESVREHRSKIRAFVDKELIPHEAEFLAKGFNKSLPFLEEKRAQVKQLGYFGPQIPKEFGGVGLGFMEFALISEELGRCPFAHFVFNCQAPDAGNMEILAEFGTPEQKEKYLRPLASGKIRSCFSMTEPDSPGSNPTIMKTTAVKEGDHYVINGHKWFTSSADGATFAIVMAVTNPDADPHERASQIIVPLDTPGYKNVRNISVMGEPGEGWASHSEVKYENVRVPITNRLGDDGAGFHIAQSRLGPGRIHHCMRWIGICERSLEIMIRRAISRELAPGEPLARRQTIQNWIAESRADIDAARLMIQHAAWRIDTVGAKEARNNISAIKFFVADVLQKVVDRALQTLGALGMTDDTVVAYYFRHERAARIYDGPDEVHKLTVARRILQDYAAKMMG
ncbi:acyl-CoA dehydrogenase family protein [bacterium]|nr:acyl-CoA dehydrogenase family protein [bacterium]